MTIGELINELEGYGKELEIKVWSLNFNRSYKISHVGRGDDEDGILDTFLSIVIDAEDEMPF